MNPEIYDLKQEVESLRRRIHYLEAELRIAYAKEDIKSARDMESLQESARKFNQAYGQIKMYGLADRVALPVPESSGK